MTPAERARQIDQKEFEAECAAIRARAFTYAKEHREREAEKIRAIITNGQMLRASKGTAPAHQQAGARKGSRTNAASAKLYTAFGRTQSASEWASETGITVSAIGSRIAKGWTIERTLTEPALNMRERAIQRRNRAAVQRLVAAVRPILLLSLEGTSQCG